MRVLIIGSWKTPSKKAAGQSDDEGRQEFAEACREIGVQLADSDVSLVIETDKENTADHHVFHGFISKQTHGPIRVIFPDSVNNETNPTPYAEARSTGLHDIRTTRQKGSWASVKIQAVLQADVVLAIGGGYGTKVACHTAVALEKPVLAIAALGKTGRELFQELEADYRHFAEIENELQIIGNKEWSATEHPAAIVRSLRYLFTNNPFVRRKLGPLLGLLAATVALLAGWLFLIQVPVGPFLNNVFGIMAVSVLLGIILHHGLRVYTNPAAAVGMKTLAIHAAVGLIVGFGLTLMYMMGGLGATGNWTFLEDTVPSDLLRVGVIFSTLGLASGFLLEASQKRLRGWLENWLEE